MGDKGRLQVAVDGQVALKAARNIDGLVGGREVVPGVWCRRLPVSLLLVVNNWPKVADKELSTPKIRS